MNTHSNPEILDRIVSEYTDRLSRGAGEGEMRDLLERVPADHRPALERCLRMVHAGLAPAPRAARVLVPGTVLGNYRLERELGRGGMSIVFLAQQIDLKRPVALKVLRPGLAIEAQHVERFRREAMSIARLQHPHIVQVHAVGETDGWNWIAMEYVEGRNLAQAYAELAATHPESRKRTAADLARATGVASLADGGASYATALCRLLAPVARAVGVAHEIGLVHRDVKPSNILIHKDGRALIADFGLAKGDGDPGLSLTGEPIGTPYYMSPEQALSTQSRVDRRTDVYSLGVTLYEGLAGRRPFEGESLFGVLDAIRTQLAPPLSPCLIRADVGVAAIVEVAMAATPAERYDDAFQLAADLDAFARGEPTRADARRGGLWTGLRRAWRASRRGQPFNYKSRGQFLGLPWVHLNFGRHERDGGSPIACGWLAVGDRARGVVAFGGRAIGLVACGGFACGGFSFGGFACGIFPFGGFAAGLLALGGMAFGYVAMGGMAVGHYAMGGKAKGQYVVTSQYRDPEAVRFFRDDMPFRLSGFDRE